MARYDVVVVGAGHNGLVAAHVLGLHGLRVAVVEQRYIPGGLASGEPRHRVWRSSYAYTLGLMPHELMEWLGLRGEAVETEPSWVELGPDGEIVFRWWSSWPRLRRELAERVSGDAASLVEDIQRFWACMKRLGLYYTVNPPSQLEAAEALASGCPGLEVFAEKRSREVLSLYGVPRWAWGLFVYSIMLGSNAFTLAYFNQNRGVWLAPRRGFQAVASRLHRLAAQSATVILGTGASEILVERGRVAGVRLSSSRVLEARAVLYAGNVACLPRLLGDNRDLLGGDALRELEAIASRRSRIIRVDAYTENPPEPPREPGWRGTPIYSVTTASAVGEVTYPSLLDPPLPGGLHAAQFSGVAATPRDAVEAVPGIDPDRVVDVEARDSGSQERCCCNPNGDPNHVPLRDPYLYDRRPLPGWADYTTPVKGLYHGSASSYPGGQVTGVPGVNAAARILLDLGLDPRLPFLERVGAALGGREKPGATGRVDPRGAGLGQNREG